MSTDYVVLWVLSALGIASVVGSVTELDRKRIKGKDYGLKLKWLAFLMICNCAGMLYSTINLFLEVIKCR